MDKRLIGQRSPKGQGWEQKGGQKEKEKIENCSTNEIILSKTGLYYTAYSRRIAYTDSKILNAKGWLVNLCHVITSLKNSELKAKYN